jgi:DNA topoisomerase-6 subunit B
MRQAVSCLVEVDVKNNKGNLKDKKTINWDRPHGVSVEFVLDGRIQLQGEGGLITYLTGTALVNPHLNLRYKLLDQPVVKVDRVSDKCPDVPSAVEPHPHTMKLGEFIAHSHLFGRTTVSSFLKKGFSRITENTFQEFVKHGLNKKILDQSVDKTTDAQFKDIFSAIHKTELMAPSTRSVMIIGEDTFSKSVRRLGEVDFFAVVTRKPTICDFKPVAIEIAVARLKTAQKVEGDDSPPVQVLRFANRVPLQFDKSACAMVKAIETVNWRAYGLTQPKNSLPLGPYVFAVSLVSPFIKFKNASKETVDASDELVEEIRRALIQAGQRLSRHIRKEHREADLEEKLRHIEQFCPILVDCLCRITKAPEKRKKAATEGLVKLLGRDVNAAKKQLDEAVKHHKEAHAKGKIQIVEKEEAKSEESDEDLKPPHPEGSESNQESEEAPVKAKAKAEKGSTKQKKKAPAKSKEKAKEKEA